MLMNSMSGVDISANCSVPHPIKIDKIVLKTQKKNVYFIESL